MNEHILALMLQELSNYRCGSEPCEDCIWCEQTSGECAIDDFMRKIEAQLAI